MMALRNVLLEIGTEEIPSRFIPDALRALKSMAEEALGGARIGYKEVRTYATPRRLVMMASDVDETQRAAVELLKGPPLASAYDAGGQPTRAALGFAKGKGVSVDALREMEVGGVRYLAAEVRQESRRTIDVLPDLLRGLIEGLTFPKSMYWNASGVRFARPIRWIVALADAELISFSYAGLSSGRTTTGHRSMGRRSIEVHDAARFMDILYDEHVILDQDKRLQKMKTSILSLEKGLDGNFQVEMDEAILEEDLYLVELPVPFVGSFDERYLDIPESVLTTSMKKHQKYLAVRNKDKGGKLAPLFIGISNNLASDMGVVREGNERVLRARLEDAAFFWEEDRKRPLAAYVERLKAVTYQEELGSVYDKVMRTQELALWLCGQLDAIEERTEERAKAEAEERRKRDAVEESDGSRRDREDDEAERAQRSKDAREERARLVDRAALLSKADLVTNMVFEFPELQGEMGMEYARCSGEGPRVALAIKEQYLPRSASDEPPTDDIGAILGLAERIHILAACHKVGLEPTGSQDPYALRRAARCINEILWARGYDLDVEAAIGEACRINEVDAPTRGKIMAFVAQRLLVQLKERGHDHELATLALSVIGRVPRQALCLIEALDAVKEEGWFVDLVGAAVRVRNILQKAPEGEGMGDPDAVLMKAGAERDLYAGVTRLMSPVRKAVASYDWDGLTKLLAELSPVIAAFFDDVMVMDPDEAVRANRLSILRRCNALFGEVGDLGSLKLTKRTD